VIKNSRILITGAGGWIGRETLCRLQSLVGSLSCMDLTLAGSQNRKIELHGEKINIVNLEDIKNDRNFDLILHFAFLTQDKISILGSEEYLHINRHINQVAAQLSRNNSQARQLALSSGAVTLDFPADAYPKNLYAQLKLEFEQEIIDDRTLLLRLWNTSGHHLGTNLNYALSEFIHLAKRNSEIHIRNNVKRSFVSAQDIIMASINYLFDGGTGIVNSGGVETDLSNLANLVVEENGSVSKIIFAPGEANSIYNYVSPESEIPQEFFLMKSNLRNQVRETSNGIH
jgi:nucleoside-diphosphate-sugar epimerase